MSGSHDGRAGIKRYRSIELFRATWGLALLAYPDRVLGVVQGLKIDPSSRAIARILGTRHLTQAVLSGYRPSPEVLAMGAWVDGVHALTALGLATVNRDRTRTGLTDAAIAGTWVAAGYRDLEHAQATTPSHQRIRDRLADIVLRHAPGGRPLRKRVDEARQRDTTKSVNLSGCPAPMVSADIRQC